MELITLLKNTGAADCPFNLKLKRNPVKLRLLEIMCLTCIEGLELPDLEPCGYRDTLLFVLELDPLENQNKSTPANFEMQLKAS